MALANPLVINDGVSNVNYHVTRTGGGITEYTAVTNTSSLEEKIIIRKQSAGAVKGTAGYQKTRYTMTYVRREYDSTNNRWIEHSSTHAIVRPLVADVSAAEIKRGNVILQDIIADNGRIDLILLGVT